MSSDAFAAVLIRLELRLNITSVAHLPLMTALGPSSIRCPFSVCRRHALYVFGNCPFRTTSITVGPAGFGARRAAF